MTKRIAIVTHYWPPHTGGIERVASVHAERLSRRGWDVIVFTTRLRGDAALEDADDRIVRRYRCVNVLERRWSVPVPLVSPRLLTDLRNIARNVDVIVAHGHSYVGTWYAALASRATRTPLVVVEHSPFVDYGPLLNTIQRVVDRTFGRWVLRRAARVISVSRFTDSYVRSIAPVREADVVLSGVDTERFFPRPHAASPRYVLTVRRLVPRNGVDILIRAWMGASLGDIAELVIVGSGPEADRLSDLARDDQSIRFAGSISDDELPKLYAGATAFVLPSLSGEGYGLAAAEALASGLPVLGTTCGAVPELVRDGEDGLLVAPGDSSSMGNALHSLLTNHDLLDKLRSGATARSRELDWDRSIDGLELSLVRAMHDAAPQSTRAEDS